MFRLLLKRSTLLMTGTLGSAALSFVQSILLTRALTHVQIGVLAIGASTVAVTFGLLGFRSVDAVNRSLSLLPKERRDLHAAVITSALGAELVAASGCMLLLFIGLPWIIPRLSEGTDAVTVALLQAVAAFFLWMDRPFQALCRATSRYHQITQITLASSALKLLVTTGLFIYDELTLIHFVILQIIVSVLAFLAQGASVRWFLKQNLSIGVSELSIAKAWECRRELGSFWRLMRASFWSSCCSSAFKQLDILLLGAWCGDAEVGLYRVAKNLASQGLTVVSSLAFSIFTEISTLSARKAYKDVWNEILRTSCLLLPVAILINLVGISLHWLIPIIYGSEYAASASLLQVQLVGITVVLVLFWAFPLLITLDGEWNYLTILAIGVFMQCGLSYLLLPGRDGAMTMAIIYSLSWAGLYAAMAVLSLRRLRRKRLQVNQLDLGSTGRNDRTQ